MAPTTEQIATKVAIGLGVLFVAIQVYAVIAPRFEAISQALSVVR